MKRTFGFTCQFCGERFDKIFEKPSELVDFYDTRYHKEWVFCDGCELQNRRDKDTNRKGS